MTIAHRTAPDPTDLWQLLEEGFEGWGQREYFEWKYDEFPGYDPERDNFVVRDGDGDVIAARRVFPRDVLTPAGDSVRVHVHGGTVVAPDHRGRGHYSTLLERSLACSRDRGAPVVTFNRRGKITTEHHRSNDWQWLTLPVAIKPLSPATLAARHVSDSDRAVAVADRLRPAARKLTASRVVSLGIATVAGSRYGGRCTAAAQARGRRGNGTELAVETFQGTAVPAETLDGFLDALAGITADRLSFARSTEVLAHAASYPGGTVVVAREADGELAGFAIAGFLDRGGLRECRVLEQYWPDSTTRQVIARTLDREARSREADVIVACADRCPGPTWIRLDTELMMWHPSVGDVGFPTDPGVWRHTAVDIL